MFQLFTKNYGYIDNKEFKRHFKLYHTKPSSPQTSLTFYRKHNLHLKIELISLQYLGDIIRRNISINQLKLRIGYISPLRNKQSLEVAINEDQTPILHFYNQCYDLLVTKDDICFIYFELVQENSNHRTRNSGEQDGAKGEKVAFREIFVPDEIREGYRTVYFGESYSYLFVKVTKKAV